MPINKVGSKGIEDGAVATADLADNVVTSDKLGDGEVSNAKLANTTVTLAGQSVALGASLSLTNKFVDWQSVITAAGSSNTAVSGQGYFIDTTSDVHTVTLPASASIGDFIAIKDYAGTFNTNNLTIARNGHNIQGVANDSLISTNRASLVLVYVDSTKGWLYWEEHNVGDLEGPRFITATGGTIATSGNFKIHTFTGDGCFVVSSIGGCRPIDGPSNVDYLVVAGGGAGGDDAFAGGGGGAGGFRTTFPSPGCNAGAFPISSITYPITVGAGGAGADAINSGNAAPGSNSVFSTITSTGGGGGASNVSAGGAGGSGGGGDRGAGGSGNTPPTSPSQGNNGGSGTPSASYGSGGGGGASAVGVNGTTTNSGNGGSGTASSITGSSVTYAGGGGGGAYVGATRGTGGTGGGGNGGNYASYNYSSGTANTGGGGGGSGRDNGAGGSGGKGIVIIRYKFQ